jgi:hypothetical protein
LCSTSVFELLTRLLLAQHAVFLMNRVFCIIDLIKLAGVIHRFNTGLYQSL